MKALIGLLWSICLIRMSEANCKDCKPSVQCVVRVCPCEYKYNPVCGTDGVTYMNKCVLDYTSMLNVDRGMEPIAEAENNECSDCCNCQKVDLPVCTLDGITYPNECELACENIKRIKNKQPIIYLAYRSACLGPPGICTDIAAPVCGTDDVLYRSKCVLDYASYANQQKGLPRIELKNNGACVDGCLCPVTCQPVCASDGKTYNNLCELECENKKRRCDNRTTICEANKVECEECRCTAEYDPVCANDGKTYYNPCELGCQIKRQQNPNLKALYSGKCPKCECDDTYAPVCGTDRKTYSNTCWLQCENIGRSSNLPRIDVFHKGECQRFACDCTHCGDEYQPVCGTDRYTYWNPCWLKCTDRCNQKNGLAAAFISKQGHC